MRKQYIKPCLTAVEIRQKSALLTFSDPHNPYNEEGGWIGNQSLEEAGLQPD